MLTADDPLHSTPQRVLVAGTSGSGKSTLAARIAVVAGAPYTEIDALYHGPDWTPRDSFVADVAALAAQQTWVTEWQYGTVRPLLLRRADLLVWLDLPRGCHGPCGSPHCSTPARQDGPMERQRRTAAVDLLHGP